jgi:chromosome partitioning protein
MTKIVSIVIRKGGSGKTTTATNLAIASAENSQSTLIIDCDYETGVAYKWFNSRDKSKVDNNIFCVEAFKISDLKDLIQTAKENNVDRIYIDTPGAGDNIVNEAVSQSDYCLIPCGAGGFDIIPIQKTVDLVNTLKKKASFLITKSPSNSNEGKDTVNVLRTFGLNISPVQLTNLKLYRDAAVLGKSVQEADPNSKPALEIKRLHKWLEERLTTNSLQKKLEDAINE